MIGISLKTRALGTLALSLVASLSLVFVYASDHDDGERDGKGRNLNLTDLYAFKENNQTTGASSENLILIMGTNPRSVARQPYYFSTTAFYEFHIARQNADSSQVKGTADVTLRFQFGTPNSVDSQAMTVTAIIDGVTFSTTTNTAGAALTTSNIRAGVLPEAHAFTLNGQTLTVFAGLREDPFFFDVEQYFRVRKNARAALVPPEPGNTPVGSGSNAVLTGAFRDIRQSVDFARGYNINAIVVRVPWALIRGTSNATVFGVWETISI